MACILVLIGSSLPLWGVVPAGGAEGYVLHYAGQEAVVGAAAVGEGLMPEDEVAGFACNGLQAGMEEDGLARILGRRQPVKPLGQGAVKSGDATEGSLIGGRVSEVEDALHAEAVWRGKRGVPVDVGAGKFPVVALGRVEAALIDGGPEILAAP